MQTDEMEIIKLAHCWEVIPGTSNATLMKKTINVFVLEDNEYYNNLLSNSIQQSINSILLGGEYQLILRSFTDAGEFIRKIKSDELDCRESMFFLDYYLGNGINAAHILKLLREYACDAMIVLLSQSKSVKDKNNLIHYDYFVVKDSLAPALCCLYLKQYIENKFCVTLD